jgi:hypothetical protein
LFFPKKFSAGESDIDQLYCIQKCLGPLPPKYMEAMKTNPKFEGLKVHESIFFSKVELDKFLS